MANQDRQAVEVLRRRNYPTTGSSAIKQGSLLIIDGSGNAIKATGTKDAVADAFIGVAIHAKPATSTPVIAVGVDGVFQMNCSGLASAVKVGDPVEYDSNDADAQGVIPGSTDPIGKVYEAAPVGSTRVFVHFVGKAVASPVVAD